MHEEPNAESWSPLNWKTAYDASAIGRVRRVAPRAGGRPGRPRRPPTDPVLMQSVNTQGYATVQLSHEGKSKTFLVHQLVCEAFHGPRPSPQHTVNHKNGDKLDNRAENLEWITMDEQRAHARQLHPDKPGWYRALTAEQAAEVLAHPEISNREWAQRLGVNGMVIQRIRRGKSYRWAGEGRSAPLTGLHWHPCPDSCDCACHHG